MDVSPTKLELEAKLVRYRELTRRYYDPVSAANMKLATTELEQKIRDFKESD